MKLLVEHGDSIHIDDEIVSEDTKQWSHSKSFLLHDDDHLEKCWVAYVCHEQFGTRPRTYELVGEEVYDHYPTEEEIMFLMCKHDSLRFSYVTIDEAWQLYDPPD